jgi:hypothetical protein
MGYVHFLKLIYYYYYLLLLLLLFIIITVIIYYYYCYYLYLNLIRFSPSTISSIARWHSRSEHGDQRTAGAGKSSPIHRTICRSPPRAFGCAATGARRAKQHVGAYVREKQRK